MFETYTGSQQVRLGSCVVNEFMFHSGKRLIRAHTRPQQQISSWWSVISFFGIFLVRLGFIRNVVT